MHIFDRFVLQYRVVKMCVIRHRNGYQRMYAVCVNYEGFDGL